MKWKLRALMADRRMTNQELADALGVHRNTVNLLREDYPTMIRLKHMEGICRVLNCTPADLFEFTGDLHPDKELVESQANGTQGQNLVSTS